jgi:nucleoside-diphosphate-sugar epimerase
MEKVIDVFGGSGFVGGRFCELADNVIKKEKYNFISTSNEVLYFISTVDNYNVHTNPYLDIDTNLTTLIRVLESCKGRDVTFNFISSWFVYGDVEMPAKETAICDPKGFYSITKRAAEQLLISYCETFNIKYRILRLANVLGHADTKVSKKKNALQYMINKVLNNEDVDLYDGGDMYRDYINVDDVVSAIKLIMDKGELNEIYNVGNGQKISIRQSLEYVKGKTNSKSNFNSIEPAEFHKIVQVKNMVLDTTKIRRLGYFPKFTMEETLDSLISQWILTTM